MLLTAHADLELITEAVNKGWVYKFITKPWEAAELRRQLRDAFAHYEKTTREKAPPAAPRGTDRAPWPTRTASGAALRRLTMYAPSRPRRI